MGTYPYSISPHFPFWEAIPNIIFCVQFESWPQQKWHNMNHKELKGALKSYPHLPYTSKECYETLEQQWISLLLTPHSISCDEGVPRNQQFAWNLSVNRGRIGMVLARRGLLMLSQAHPTLFIHLRKVMDHFSSNGYLSSEHNISFFILRGYPKSSILCEIWMSILTGIAQFDTSGACRCCQKVV